MTLRKDVDLKVVIFDRGDTLEHEDVLLPGAIDMLTAVAAMKDADGHRVVMGLVSDFGKAADTAEIARLRKEYCDGLRSLGIAAFFAPLRKRVTLSSDLLDPAFAKPHESIFRAALDKIGPAIPFARALFITETLAHIQAVRAFGMAGIHFKGPGQAAGDVAHLADLPAKIREWLAL